MASYPRSGNTLVRIALNRILQGPDRQLALDEDFPEYDHRGPFPTNGVAFPGRDGPVVFMKTHWCQPLERESSIGAIYLVRHPIDVFLSGINYIFLEHEKYEAFRQFFGDDGPQRVEELAEAGKLDGYLDRLSPNRDYGRSGFTPEDMGAECSGLGRCAKIHDDDRTL